MVLQFEPKAVPVDFESKGYFLIQFDTRRTRHCHFHLPKLPFSVGLFHFPSSETKRRSMSELHNSNFGRRRSHFQKVNRGGVSKRASAQKNFVFGNLGAEKGKGGICIDPNSTDISIQNVNEKRIKGIKVLP